MTIKLTCPTNLISDIPDSTDYFTGAHDRVATAIVSLIRSEVGGKSIGIEGSYGSGKTTVINLIRAKLKTQKNIYLIPFDAWAHEGDPLRRTFLENLIRALIKFNSKEANVIDESKWNKRLEELAQRREVKSTRTIPYLTPFGKILTLSIFLVPFGLAFVNAALRDDRLTIDMSLPFSRKFAVGVCLTIAPLLAITIKWILSKLSRNSASTTNQEGLWALLFNKAITEDQTETIKTPNPTSLEFEEVFEEIMDEALGDTNRRIILVLDNLDRVNSKDALSIWSTLQTFIGHSHYDLPDWFTRLWIIVLYDPRGIRSLWDNPTKPPASNPNYTNEITGGNDQKQKSISNSFIEKSFQIRFQVPPPVLSDWHSYLLELLIQGLPKHPQSEFHGVYRVLETYLSQTKSAPTMRSLKLYVNQIGAIHRQWGDTFPLAHVAYYVLTQTDADESIQWFLTHPTANYEGILDDSTRETLAALTFNVEKDKALQFLLNQPIKKALIEGDVEGIKQYAEFRKGFWEILERAVTTERDWVEGITGRLAIAAYCLSESKLLVTPDTPDTPEVEVITKALCNRASEVPAWTDLDNRKGIGLASLCKWRPDIDFATRLLEAVANGIIRLPDKNEYVPINVSQTTEALKIISSSLEVTGLGVAFSRGVLEPLGSRVRVPIENMVNPPIGDEINNLLEILYELKRFNKPAENLLQGLLDDGYLLRHFHVAVINYNNLGSKQVPATIAWCLYMLLESLPNFSSLIQSNGRHTSTNFPQQQASLLKVLNLEWLEGASTAEELIQRTNELIESFTEILTRYNNLKLLFLLLDEAPQSNRLVVKCIELLSKDSARIRMFITPDIYLERWQFLQEDLTAQAFKDITKLLINETGLMERIVKTEFASTKAELYSSLADAGGMKHKTFRKWCVKGLQSTTREEWQQQLTDTGELTKLIIVLISEQQFLDLNEDFLDALTEHARSFLSKPITVSQTKMFANITSNHIHHILDEAKQSLFQKRLYEMAIEADGDISEDFFQIFGDTIKAAKILFVDERMFSHLLIPLITKNNLKGIEWLTTIIGDKNFNIASPSAIEFHEFVEGRFKKLKSDLDRGEDPFLDTAEQMTLLLQIMSLLEGNSNVPLKV